MVWTIKRLLDVTSDYLKEKKISSPRLNTELLLAHVMNYENRLNLYLDFDKTLTTQELDSFRELIKKRVMGEPVQYITGYAQFFNHKLKVTGDVLIPRPETEFLVEKVIEKIRTDYEKDETVNVLDIGTGSGAIILTLNAELENVNAFGLDISRAALRIASENAANVKSGNTVSFFASDLFTSVKPGFFDVIISNPPYVSINDWENLSNEVKNYEPETALKAGSDGLFYYRKLISQGGEYLKESGWMFLEIGEEMKKRLSEIAEKAASFSEFDFNDDLSGRLRFMFLKK